MNATGRPKGSPERLEERRRLALKMLSQGIAPQQVADSLGVTRDTVYGWRAKEQKLGPEALKAKPHTRRQSQLTPRDRKKLARLLLQGAQKHGWNQPYWTLERVAKVIEKEFGITFHPCHVWRILVQMNWSCQKPQRVPREQNPKEVKKFREQTWPRIKRGKKDGHLSG